MPICLICKALFRRSKKRKKNPISDTTLRRFDAVTCNSKCARTYAHMTYIQRQKLKENLKNDISLVSRKQAVFCGIIID